MDALYREYGLSPGKPLNQNAESKNFKKTHKNTKNKTQQQHQSLEGEEPMTELLQHVILIAQF